MYVVEVLLGLTLLSICIKSTVTDIKNGFIYNHDIKKAFAIGIALNAIYYLFFVQDIFIEYLWNLGVILFMQWLLYKTNSFAGGDFKLGITIAFLYPARMYIAYKGIVITLFFYLGFAIFYGYLYLLVSSIKRIIRHQSSLNFHYIITYTKSFLISYARASLYIFAITLLASKLGEYIFFPSWMLWLICMLMSLESRKLSFLKSKKVLIVVALLDAILSVMQKTIPFSIYPETYLFSGIMLLCQMVISSTLYEVVATANVKSGMILSTSSSLLMQSSRVKGLPGISSENLNDRLTDEQVVSIKRWGNTKSGTNQVIIMRKIPFAIFLLMGIMTYFIIWIIRYEI